MGRLVLTVGAAICVLLPASAGGAVRHASLTGAGADCSEVAPCTLEAAVSGALADDEIVVGAGTYVLGATLEPSVPLTIRGTPGRERPSIAAAHGLTVLRSSFTIAVSDLTFQSRNADTLFLAGPGSTAERIEAVAISDTGALALRAGNGLVLRNSLVRAYGTDAVALFYQATEPNRVTLRNVTAFASGVDSIALAVFATEPAPGASIEAANVIAEASLDASATAHPASNSEINFSSSNFTSGTGGVVGVGTQILPPVFVNAAAGDFRQAPGSPTIDAGITDPANGPLDLDAGARVAGSATDIGAYEFLPPPPAPVGASAVDASAVGTIIGALRLSRKGVVSATLGCPASESRCAWSYQLRSRRRVRTRGKRRVIAFGSGRASAAGGKRVTVRIKLSKRNFRLIRSKRRLSVKLTARMTDAAANVATTKRNATLKAPRRAARARHAAP